MGEVLSWNNLNVEEQPLEKIQTNQQVLTWDSLNTNQEEIDDTTVVKSENVLSWDNLDAKPVEESKISE